MKGEASWATVIVASLAIWAAAMADQAASIMWAGAVVITAAILATGPRLLARRLLPLWLAAAGIATVSWIRDFGLALPA